MCVCGLCVQVYSGECMAMDGHSCDVWIMGSCGVVYKSGWKHIPTDNVNSKLTSLVVSFVLPGSYCTDSVSLARGTSRALS